MRGIDLALRPEVDAVTCWTSGWYPGLGKQHLLVFFQQLLRTPELREVNYKWLMVNKQVSGEINLGMNDWCFSRCSCEHINPVPATSTYG